MRILVIRLSAMGDVALTLPAVKSFVERYPGHELTILTRPAFSTFFRGIPTIRLFTPDLNNYKGLYGIWKIYRDLAGSGRFDIVIDLHDVIRSKILRCFFCIAGTPVFSIDKGRREKRGLVSGRGRKKLRHTVERYADVFRRAGFELALSAGKFIDAGSEARKKVDTLFSTSTLLNIGIAPFARHELKQWPVEYMVSLMRMISGTVSARFWLFGGTDECERLAGIEKVTERSVNLCGKLSLEEEIAVMERLDFMIAMDSANMHMAALVGTKAVSIWGGTDPLAGFGAWGQPPEYSIRISPSELECRPCTIYGKGRCKRKDLACLYRLTPEIVFGEIVKLGLLKEKNRI